MYTFCLSISEHKAMYKRAERSGSTTRVHSHLRSRSQSCYKILIFSNRKKNYKQQTFI